MAGYSRKSKSASSAAPEIGDRLKDGTIYFGGNLCVMPVDAGYAMTFNAAADKKTGYPTILNEQKAHGHDDWRLPTKSELKLLRKNRNKGVLKGTFNLSGRHPDGSYWSSTPGLTASVWVQQFSNGVSDLYLRYYYASVRCVRTLR